MSELIDKGSQSEAAAEVPAGDRVRFGMRGRMLVAFGLAFTLVFLVVAIFTVGFVTRTAENRLTLQLEQTAVGGSSTLDAAQFAEVIATGPAYNPDDPWPVGDPAYDAQNAALVKIRDIVPEASPYSYYRDPVTGELLWATSWAVGFEDYAVVFRGKVADIVPPVTYALMERGLEDTVNQGAYTDANGSWISTYTPIRGADGSVVGGLGIDYSLAYVDEVRANALRVVIPVLIVSYVLLLAVVLIISAWLARPLKRLTEATRRIAAGEYDLDMSGFSRTRIPDEMSVLSRSFATMVEKVGARERTLTQQVRRLTVQIDEEKRRKEVSAITDSDFFTDLTAKAATMRARIRAEDAPSAGTSD